MKKPVVLAVLVFLISTTHAQYAVLYPSNWYTGMKWNKVQVIAKGDYEGFKQEKVAINYPGVRLLKVHSFENGKYLALDLLIAANAKPGDVIIEFIANNKAHAVAWPLKARRSGAGKTFAQGVTAKDLIYLLMPDRFANGDPSNDRVSGYLDTMVSRKDPLVRHGGDLQGVENQLDYLKDLGVTAIWMTPVLENDMPLQSEQAGMMAGYHGYWITDHYAVDKRMGGNEVYRKLVDAAHARGIKMIQDAVYNHVGIEHWFYKDAPAKDWINRWSSYTNTHHREETMFGQNGSETEQEIMLNGWFVPHLPDVNQRNPFVANYLIQHALWSVEEFGIDGWRVDTYKYCDEAFMNKVNIALETEYPSISVFGESVANTVTGSAYFTRNNFVTGFKHNVQGVTDFPLSYAMLEAINKPQGWTEGMNKLYMTLAQDMLYKAPEKNCIFLDNHDSERFISMVGEDFQKYKMGMAFLMTLRGIPQLYYGTEIWMKNFKQPNDGMVRLDFPGGFAGDAENKFQVSGRTAREQEAFTLVQKLANFRKGNSALQTGRLMQYLPKDGMYVYFRYDQNHTVMCILNGADKPRDLRLQDYAERTRNFRGGQDVLTGVMVEKSFTIGAKETMILLLR
ncbi:MAG TPA: alpha-amylase family glycosyl hydrolase [Sediminibacterium sp.]|nr:alpha-amylase family glycosyl hydrolase [Sediminibacterium sp.]